MPDILPKPKPKNFTKILDMLNTKAAANQFSTKTYVNLVGEFSKKAYDNGELSEKEYMEIVRPLFGDAGIMASKKIQEEKDYINSYAIGGRVNYGLGDVVRASSIVQPVPNSSGGPIPSSGMGGMLSKLINSNPQIFSKLNNSQTANMLSSNETDFIDENLNGIDDRQEVAYGGRIGLKDGTDYWAMVTEMYIKSGGQEATGMDIQTFADKYFND